MTNNQFVLVGNGSYRNRGCEAIVRGTVHILREVFASPTFVNANFDVASPPYLPEETDPFVVHRPVPRVEKKSAVWLAARAMKRLHPPTYRRLLFRGLAASLDSCRAVLSIGGDNYSLDYGVPTRFIDLDRFVAGYRKPLVIWGASVGPFDANPAFARQMHAHLRDEVTAIFVREERSRRYLEANGIRDRVFLMPDPGFLMAPTPVAETRLGCELPANAIGLNLSPLMATYWTGGDVERLTEAGAALVTQLRKRFGRPVVLIPHVTSPRKNDFILLRAIRNALDDKDGVCCLPDTLNAAETKWVVARLDCLIASRTHATVASLSSCVPTVSLAYSVKAYGLNEGLFGHTKHVVKPEEFSVEAVVSKTAAALEKADAIRAGLHASMQGIRTAAHQAGLTLKRVIES